MMSTGRADSKQREKERESERPRHMERREAHSCNTDPQCAIVEALARDFDDANISSYKSTTLGNRQY